MAFTIRESIQKRTCSDIKIIYFLIQFRLSIEGSLLKVILTVKSLALKIIW